MVVLAVGVGVVVFLMARESGPQPPSPDLTGREPQVRDKLEALRGAIVEKPSDASRWFEFGRCLQALEMHEEARACYEVSAGDEKLAFDSHYLTGVLLRARDREAAEAAFAHAAALRDDYLALHVRRGELAEEAGDAEAAEGHYRKALEVRRSSHALLGLGRLALAADDAAEARALLKEAARLSPSHKQVFAVLSAACNRLGDKKAAQRHARTAERLDDARSLSDPIAMKMLMTSNSFVSYLQAARAVLTQGGAQAELALHYADRAAALRDDLAQPHYLRFRALWQLERLPDALAALQRVLEIEPENVEALGNAGGLLMKLNRPREAKRFLNKAIEVDPYDPNALYLSSVLVWRHAPDEAERLVRRALESDPEDIEAHLHLATILAAVGKIPEAETSLRTALRIAPGHPRATTMLDTLLREKKKL